MNKLEQLLDKKKEAGVELSYQNFDRVVGFIEKEQMKPALQIIEQSFSEGIYDIRFLFYYMYAHFLDKGIVSLQELLPIIVSMAEDHFEKLVPLNKKETHIQTSLNWFFSNILKKLKYKDRLLKTAQKSSGLESSMTCLGEKEFNQFIDVLHRFHVFFYEKWPDSPVRDKVSNLVKKIEELRNLIVIEETNIPVEVEEEIVLEKEEEDFVFEQAEPESFLSLQKNEESSLFKSDLMVALIKKMKVFEELIEKQDYLKAALVSKDISYIIEHFDPCAYFPQVFSRYLSLMAKNISQLSEEWGNENSLKWNSLDKLYKTDIEKFITLS